MQQIAEGTIRRSKRDGRVETFQGGQWVPQGAAPAEPALPREILGPPKVQEPPSGYHTVPGGLAPIPGGPADPVAQPPKPQEPPSGFRWTSDGGLEAIPGGPADKGATRGEENRANTIQAITGEVRRLYEQDIKGQPASRLFGATEYIDSLPANDRFRSAGNTILPLIRPLIAQTAKEGDSDKEMQVFQSYVPSNDDSDISIEQKFKMLELLIGGMIDGRAPSETLASASPASQEINGRRVFSPQGGEQKTLATGETRIENNPAWAGANDGVNQMLKAGAGDGEIIAFLRNRAGMSGRELYNAKRQLIEIRKFQKQSPGYKGDYRIDVEKIEVPNSTANRIAASGPATAIAAAGDAVTGYSLDSIIGATGGDEELARLGLGMARQQNPGWGLAGDVAGGTLAALTAEAGLARMGMAPSFGRGLLADTSYGAAAGAGMSDDGNRLAGAGLGALAGGAGNVAGNALARGVGNALTGVTDPSVQALRQSKTPLTIGQTVGRSGRVGGIVKGAEDRLSGLPGVGDMINARRTEGITRMNAKAFDKALEPINKTAGGKVGEEGVQEAHAAVQQAFREALDGKSAQLDVDFVRGSADALNRLRRLKRNDIGNEVVDQIEEVTRGYIDPTTGELTGENMQAMLGSLREIRQAYKADPLGKRIGDEVRKIERSVEGMFERQAPEVMPKYNNAKQAYRRVSILANTVNRAKNSEGVFTSGQLGMSDRQNSTKFDGAMAAASGKGQFHDFQRDAQNVLPNKVPDSGTAGRLATAVVPGAIAGSGAGIGFAAGDTQSGAQAGLGIASITAALYTRQGQRALAALAAKRGQKSVKAGKKIKGQARLAGAVGAQGAITSIRD